MSETTSETGKTVYQLAMELISNRPYFDQVEREQIRVALRAGAKDGESVRWFRKTLEHDSVLLEEKRQAIEEKNQELSERRVKLDRQGVELAALRSEVNQLRVDLIAEQRERLKVLDQALKVVVASPMIFTEAEQLAKFGRDMEQRAQVVTQGPDPSASRLLKVAKNRRDTLNTTAKTLKAIAANLEDSAFEDLDKVAG